MKIEVGLVSALVAGSLALSGAAAAPAVSDPGRNPKIRPWQEYPFVQKPEPIPHASLWQEFAELPEWAQRGRFVYYTEVGSKPEVFEALLRQLKADGVGLVHYGPIRGNFLTPEMVAAYQRVGLPLIMRLDGQFFWDRNYLDLMESMRPGGWAKYHNTVPNTDWYRKFPLSLAATRVMRDGQPLIEYYGSKWVQRRDLNYIHPVSIQMRDAFLRECVLGEQVFDRPIGLACAGHVQGVWWDNPGNTAVSYDPYSWEVMAREFEKVFGAKCRQYFDQWMAEQPEEKRKTLTAPEALEKAWRAWRDEAALWFGDPPTLWMRFHDQEMKRWWESFWADAYAGYYAWQYRFLQTEIAPKLGLKHLFVGGNSKLCWSASSWDYYLFSWPTYDLLGPNETTVIYTDKTAPGYKLALAASNGKPAGLWHHGNALEYAEALACLGVIIDEPQPMLKFHMVNLDLYHNALPGARVAVTYHLEDGLHHNEIANLCRVTDQIWRSGAPLEIITERHLSVEVLKAFDVVVVPGFRFTDRETQALKQYAEAGGRLLLIGDNEDAQGRRLAAALAGLAPWQDGEAQVGQGRLKCFNSQLITDAQMAAALADLGGLAIRVTQPANANLLVNVLTQPARQLTGIHLVNFTGQAIAGLRLKVPEALAACPAAFISPYGGQTMLTVAGGTLTVPQLNVYGVIVLASDVAARDAVLARNNLPEFTPSTNALPTIKVQGDIPKRQVKVEDLKLGEKLCYFRQYSKAGFRRMDADIVTAGQGRVGQAQAIRLRIHAVGLWVPAGVFIDKVAFVMKNEETGYRETVAVPMDTVQGQTGGETVREKDFAVPAGTFIARESEATWKPSKAGRYQLYLSYRYVDEVYEGKPDLREDKQYPLSDYFFSRPLCKIVYEDKLPCLIVDVTE